MLGKPTPEQAIRLARWRDGEMARWRDGEMARWRDGEMARLFSTILFHMFFKKSLNAGRSSL